ncbi:ferrous iron efflux protein F [compost metagenome]
MHVDLEPGLTLEAAHAIVVEAEQRIEAAFPHADILIHADPRGAVGPHEARLAEATAGNSAEAATPALSAATPPGPWS